MTEIEKPKQVKNYDILKQDFIKFMALPQRDKTQGEWAEANGVNQNTLSEWKGQPWYKEALVQEVEKYLGDDLSDIYKSLRKKAKSGDIAAINLYLKQYNILKADKNDNVNQHFVADFKDIMSVIKEEVNSENRKSAEVKDS